MKFMRNTKARIIIMNQKSYIKEVLKHFNMEKCKPVGTSFNVNFNFLKLSNEKFGNVRREMEGVPYTTKIGSLMYVMVDMRVDIAFALSIVSQFMSKGGLPHIMRYLKGTLDFKLCLGGKDIDLYSFCDPDWVGDANDQRSTT